MVKGDIVLITFSFTDLSGTKLRPAIVLIEAESNEIQEIGRRKLRMLNNAQNLTDLQISPSNKLEKLKSHLKEFYSIRINDQWRIIFRWSSGNATAVEIIDYH